MKSNSNSIIWLSLFGVILLGCGPKKIEVSCLEVEEMMTSGVSTAGVRTLFKVTDCDGNPVPNVTNQDVSIALDGKSMQSEGNVSMVLNQNVTFELNTLLLLDMSDSIVQNGHLDGMVTAARVLVKSLTTQGHRVAIYRFAGPSWFGPVTDFTNDMEELNAGLNSIATGTGLGTTDLYGAITRGVRLLENRKKPATLSAESMVLFTDGTDEAMVGTRNNADNVIQSSDVYVYTVGLGSDVNQDELNQFGKNGFEWAANTNILRQSFAKITTLIQNLSKSYYMMGICSPRVGGTRTIEITVTKNGKSGVLTTEYDATGFDIVGCSPQQVAFPCMERQCGSVDGFMCGSCGESELCSDAGICTIPCDASVECGMVSGVDCGSCEQGATFTCSENQCVDACAEMECGLSMGVNCGDCSERGTTWRCSESGSCEDACESRECGTVGDANCGDCSEYGPTWGCTTEGTCVEACGTRECGSAGDVYCGDCSAYGSTWGCTNSGVCTEMCGERQCGTVNGVSCGTCDTLGDSFGCKDGECVDACAGIQCGYVDGIYCGGCDTGMECSNANQCVPTGMGEMDWVFVEGGDTTLGCEWSLDANCDDDEQRVVVTLSDYYMMDSEATAGMFADCVSDGGCNASDVATTTGCTFNGITDNDEPINCITYEGMERLCKYLGGELPTEAQWEYAARSGYDGVDDTYRVYPWGDSPSPDCNRVVMNDPSPGCGTNRVFEVKSLQPNDFGLYDMMGNVSEWTQDLYSDVLGGCSGPPCIDPQGPAVGDEQVIRGGSYNSMYTSAFRTAARDKEMPDTTSSAIGGRCVLNITK